MFETKKILAILVMLVALIAINTTLVSAKFDPQNIPEGVGDNIDFDKLKESTLTILDKSINALNNAEDKVETNSKISNESKQSIIEALNKVENGLITYKSEVEAATTLDELKAINQEIAQYIKDNKDVIKENIKTAIIDISEQVVIKIEEFKEKVEQILKVLKKTCPSETETITELETQLQQLDNEINDLKQANQIKDTVAIKQEIQGINQLSKDIVNNLKKIEVACLQ